MEYYLGCFKKYATFSGRARRKEYWMFMLFSFIVSVILRFIDETLGITVDNFGILNIYGILVFIPGLAVSVRRLHDIEKSGWLVVVPYGVGIIIFIISFIAFFMAAGAQLVGGKPMAIASLGVSAIILLIIALAYLAFSIYMLVLFCTAGTPGPNKYGPDPKQIQDDAIPLN